MGQNVNRNVVIVGAGHAGASAALQLRQNGWQGAITLLGAEGELPYQRPPLSKAWLKGAVSFDGVVLRKAEVYQQQGIALRCGCRVVALDRGAKVVVLSDGARVPYDVLILATGSRPRDLPVPDAGLDGVVTLRTVADADGLRSRLGSTGRLVVIGGGYIGLEVASAARALGRDVVVVEREARLLARVASPEVSDFYAALHAARGVDLRLSAAVEAIGGRDGRVTEVMLTDGTAIPADTVLVGVGAIPESALAEAAGLACQDGIRVSSTCGTDDPDIYAIGDVSRRPLPFNGGAGRLESVQNALEQARQVAASLCGLPAPAPEVPWFWSDQYEVKLQLAGLPGSEVHRVMRGVSAEGRFAVFHIGTDDTVRAVEAVNMPAEFMTGRQWIAQRRAVSPARLADVAVGLKDAAV
ncbi:3-phenylpropionate/trans-cinnamate dioxygenase ferredoxin reductase subunit [Nitrospirillum amazonense]|uniref:3-phenylpropionate/trans-cinnamate dioxygenase ferredoxin reductase subunit n=1 Tax=Nitrospirillum amazonense TaxID=28077 RepID=A0A560F9W4_9PROT|nr:FAD-dependent oxidoreductase [Nitrospirillum amazonense]TWB18403.1 3-phenylpropionate/trans-cinnamate dioxygenase ferredoxin reductase subunit [Nitrospirillum amazonense]TWB66076.1 3-phenylpropionate/trans-cinnamate dioxygenase ferredoxin reductase subunit [Nitrospirillum amazonense]